MRVALASLGLTTTVRMIDGVHGRTANGRLDTAPALGASLAELLEAVRVVADFAHRRAAFDRHLAHLAGAKTQRGVPLLASDQLHAGTGGTSDLRALARL